MIKPYTLKNGEVRYYNNVYLGINETTGDEDRVKKSGFKSVKEAKAFGTRIKAQYDKDKDMLNKKKKEKKKFGALVEEWLEIYKKTVKLNTFEKERDRINLHIVPHFKNKYITKITVKDCQTVVNHWYATYAKANTLANTLIRIFKYAINQDYIDSNPADKVIRPKNTHKKEYKAKFYNKEQLQRLFESIKDEPLHIRTMFRVLAFAGLRTGEILGLHWSEVDLTNKMIEVKQVLVLTKEKGYVLQPPKNTRSERKIGIDQRTVDLLAELKNNSNSDYVFSNVKGEHFNIYYCKNTINDIIAKYDLPKITAHGFRHTHCSLLFEAGVEMNDVRDRLGHATIQTTLNVYAHITESKRNETAEKFSNYIDF